MADDELLSAKQVCAFFGRIHLSTLYRGMRRGVYPSPIRVGERSVRWRKSECEDALQRLALMKGKQ